jgi:hypothetical protein
MHEAFNAILLHVQWDILEYSSNLEYIIPIGVVYAIITIITIIEQVNLFNYLGNMISYEKELDIDNKLHNYLKITGILNNVFRPQKLLRKQEKYYTTH